MRDAAVGGEHAAMTAEPVAILHVLRRPCVEQLAEAEHGDEHPGAMDLAGLQIKPLDRIASVIDFDPLAGGELASGDARLPVLRELAVELLPKIRVGRQAVSYTHLRAHETGRNLVCRLLLEKKK